MKFLPGLLILAAYLPYMACSDSAAAAAAAAASKSNNGGSSSAAAAAAAAAGNGAAAAAAAAASASSAGHTRAVRCPCTLEYNPVCGTDGNTYSNECMLKCVSNDNIARGFDPIKVYRYGQCPPIPCRCPKIYDPVCSVKNQTYPSECYLNCENEVRRSNGLKPIKIKYRAVCHQATSVCPDAVIPKCGTDGKTYRNICVLEYYSRIETGHGRPAIRVASHGACAKESCTCTLEINELCATDGNTYVNDCVLGCTNRRLYQLREPLLGVRHRGKCVGCQCTADYSPVCAKDRAFYDYEFGNYCQFLCNNRKRVAANLPPLTLRWKDRCDCGCSREWKPVCDVNGYTHQNICQLRCISRKRVQDIGKDIPFKHNGICNWCNCSHCGNAYNPVCGTDRQTYWNPCWLRCYNACRGTNILKAHNGACWK